MPDAATRAAAAGVARQHRCQYRQQRQGRAARQQCRVWLARGYWSLLIFLVAFAVLSCAVLLPHRLCIMYWSPRAHRSLPRLQRRHFSHPTTCWSCGCCRLPELNGMPDHMTSALLSGSKLWPGARVRCMDCRDDGQKGRLHQQPAAGVSLMAQGLRWELAEVRSEHEDDNQLWTSFVTWFSRCHCDVFRPKLDLHHVRVCIVHVIFVVAVKRRSLESSSFDSSQRSRTGLYN